MNGFPWLTVAGAVPLLGAIVIALIPGLPADSAEADRQARNAMAKMAALGFSLLTLVVVIIIAVKFQVGGPNYQFTESYSWIPAFGVHYALGVDGIALVLIAMSVVLMPVVILASWHDAECARSLRWPGSARHAPAAQREDVLLADAGARDDDDRRLRGHRRVPVLRVLRGHAGADVLHDRQLRDRPAPVRGGQVPALQPARRAAHAGRGHRAVRLLRPQRRDRAPRHLPVQRAGARVAEPGGEKWLFLGFFIAFAIKAPLWPFHTWLPDAAAAAPPGAAVLLVGVLDKVGTFGMLRYCFELFPSGAKYFTPLVITLSVIGILYGAIVAIGQQSMKRLIAYTSVSHFGFIALGIFAMTSQGVSGATFYMVNHGFATGALFILAGFLIARRGTDRIADFGGVQSVAPVLAGLFLISGLAMLSLPGLSTFVSEFLVLIGTFSRYKVPAVIATAGIILAAIYVLWMYQRAMNGPVRDEVKGMPDLRPRELLAVAPLVVLLIGAGVYPKPVLDIINPAVKVTMSQVHTTDPKPAHPAGDTTAAQKGTAP